MTHPDHELTRRSFIQAAAGAAAGAALNLAESRAEPVATTEPAPMPHRPLGRTGHEVPLFSLGGQATLETPDRTELALAIIHRAMDLGVTYLDTAATYGQGVSETYLGQVMKTRRKEVFLNSKTSQRTYDGAMRTLEKSLKNLQTDHLDSWQMHHIDTQDDVDTIFGPDGAIKAFEKAREQKMVRFLGVTGHRDPEPLLNAINQYAFDTILMALNAADRHNHSFIEKLLPTAVEKKMGIIGMKVVARGAIFKRGGLETMDQAMNYVLTLPVSTVVVGIGTVAQLEQNIEIARKFKPLTADQMVELENLTKPYARAATYFRKN